MLRRVTSFAAISLLAGAALAQHIPPAVDFALCSAQSRLIGEVYESKADLKASVAFKLRARTLLNLARELGRLDNVPEAITQRTYDDVYRQFRGYLASPERTLALLEAYTAHCTKIVEAAREIAPRFPRDRLER
jgi:hypothetical protein